MLVIMTSHWSSIFYLHFSWSNSISACNQHFLYINNVWKYQNFQNQEHDLKYVIFTHCLKKKLLKANTKSFFLLLKIKFDSTHKCCSFNNCISNVAVSEINATLYSKFQFARRIFVIINSSRCRGWIWEKVGWNALPWWWRSPFWRTQWRRGRGDRRLPPLTGAPEAAASSGTCSEAGKTQHNKLNMLHYH